jgi:hypothetical protein
MNDEAIYNCDSCGKEIVVPIDLTAGSRHSGAISFELVGTYSRG